MTNDNTTDKTKQAQNKCAELQRKLILTNKWTDQDRKEWDRALFIILTERARQRK